MRWFRKEDPNPRTQDELVLTSINVTQEEVRELIEEMRRILLTPDPSEIFIGDFKKDIEKFSKLANVTHLLEDRRLASTIDQIADTLPRYLIIKQLEMHTKALLRMKRTVSEGRTLGWKEKRRFQRIKKSVETMYKDLTQEQKADQQIATSFSMVTDRIAFLEENI